MSRPFLAAFSCCLLLAVNVANDANGEESPQLQLQLPVNCALGSVCVIQNYFDHDSGPSFQDYTCGRRGYDGHDGTDIRVPNLATMREGVAVLAAAPGRVRAIRDEMPDVSVAEVGRQAVEGREAGNSVAIDHGDGWETQYSHLRRGSVLVKPGDSVHAGQAIGLIGMSGNAEFPHLHFEVRRDGRSLDPFVGLVRSEPCDGSGNPLWEARTLQRLDYPPAGLLQAGFATEAPTSKAVLDGAYTSTVLPASAPGLVFWVESFGVQKGDRETLNITDPSGQVLVEKTESIPGDKARWLRFVGKKRRMAPWPPGHYHGSYRLVREVKGHQQPVLEIERQLQVR